jgi:hypothetical protein
MMLSRTPLAGCLVLLALLSACSTSTTDVIVKGTTKITTGQEMVDLQRAVDQGAITPDEFGELKERILRRN